MAKKQRVTIQVRGLAGTGKTTVAAILMEALEGLGIKCSYTGQDTESIRERICEAMVNEIPDGVLDNTEVEIIEEVSELTPEMKAEAMTVEQVIHERQNALKAEEFEKKHIAMIQSELDAERDRVLQNQIMKDMAGANVGTSAIDTKNTPASAEDFFKVAENIMATDPGLDKAIGFDAIEQLRKMLDK